MGLVCVGFGGKVSSENAALAVISTQTSFD